MEKDVKVRYCLIAVMFIIVTCLSLSCASKENEESRLFIKNARYIVSINDRNYAINEYTIDSHNNLIFDEFVSIGLMNISQTYKEKVIVSSGNYIIKENKINGK